ncbi:MAG: DUF1638 domain-containing protein [Planctomycetes bacterium]|nr:DUF1638 domain-containing protein [Planctomycetota bacterium]
MTERARLPKEGQQRVRAIACEIVCRELCFLAALARNIVDLVFLPKGLHDVETPDMVAAIQQAIDTTGPDTYDAIVLAYGLCNNGTVGLRARSVPLVIPRAHDCITFFLGSRQHYQEQFEKHPGTYYRTTGWSERNFAVVEGRVRDRLGLNRTYDELVHQYGEENARYIHEMTTGWQRNYERMAYIELGLGGALGHDRDAAQEADRRGWRFVKLAGDLTLLARLLDGPWEDEFLVVPPGYRVVATNDTQILTAQPDQGVAEPAIDRGKTGEGSGT